MLFQTGESIDFCLWVRKLEFWRCFVVIDCTHRPGLPIRIFHANINWKALLVASVFRSPRPPALLGLHILSHATISSPFSVLDFFQKKSLLYLSNKLVAPLGNWKHCIMWGGNDSSWDWIKTALPAFDKQLVFQASNFVVALLIISWNVVFEGHPWKAGQPKYLLRGSLRGIWRIAVTIYFWIEEALRDNVNADLW